VPVEFPVRAVEVLQQRLARHVFSDGGSVFDDAQLQVGKVARFSVVPQHHVILIIDPAHALAGKGVSRFTATRTRKEHLMGIQGSAAGGLLTGA
jgi:heat shock protein HspQ